MLLIIHRYTQYHIITLYTNTHGRPHPLAFPRQEHVLGRGGHAEAHVPLQHGQGGPVQEERAGLPGPSLLVGGDAHLREPAPVRHHRPRHFVDPHAADVARPFSVGQEEQGGDAPPHLDNINKRFIHFKFIIYIYMMLQMFK